MMKELAILSVLQFVGLRVNGEYEYIGCYAEGSDRALRYGPYAYGYTADTCSTACADYKYFGLQDGGWCCCDDSFHHARKYGIATNCPATRLGAPGVNDLFENLAVSSYPEGTIVFISDAMTADDAKIHCEDVYDANLVSIHTQHRNEEVTNLCVDQGQTQQACWLGMSNLVTPTHWFDGTPIDYTSWYTTGNPIEPDAPGVQNCVDIRGVGSQFAGFWYTVGHCADSLPFICECKGFEISPTKLKKGYNGLYGSIPVSSDMQFTFDVSLIEAAWTLQTIFELKNGNGLTPIQLTVGCNPCGLNPDPKMVLHLNFQGETKEIVCDLPSVYGAKVTYHIDVTGKTVKMSKDGVVCSSHTFLNEILDEQTMDTDFDLFSTFNDLIVLGRVEHMFITSKPACEPITEAPTSAPTKPPTMKPTTGPTTPAPSYVEGNIVFISQAMTADAAQTYCQSQYGANLVSIHSPYRNAEITDLCVDQGQVQAACWLGMSNAVTPTQWFDGTLIDYTSWYDPGEPDAPGTQNCVEIRGSGSSFAGFWYSVGHCDMPLPFICECGAFEISAVILNTVHTSYGSIPISSDMQFMFDLSLSQSLWNFQTIFGLKNENGLIPIELTGGCNPCGMNPDPKMVLHLNFQGEIKAIVCELPPVNAAKVTYDIDIDGKIVTMSRDDVVCGTQTFLNDIVDQETMDTNFDLVSGDFNQYIQYGNVEKMLVTSKPACEPITEAPTTAAPSHPTVAPTTKPPTAAPTGF